LVAQATIALEILVRILLHCLLQQCNLPIPEYILGLVFEYAIKPIIDQYLRWWDAVFE